MTPTGYADIIVTPMHRTFSASLGDHRGVPHHAISKRVFGDSKVWTKLLPRFRSLKQGLPLRSRTRGHGRTSNGDSRISVTGVDNQSLGRSLFTSFSV